MKIGREYIIQGRVQGVGFRFFTYQWMKKQPITGYVWNRDDGSVGIRAFAREDALKKLEDWQKLVAQEGQILHFGLQQPVNMRKWQIFQSTIITNIVIFTKR